MGKVLTKEEIAVFRKEHSSKQIVFTNGCFDILHAGHVDYLQKAAGLGDVLVVGLNSDESVRRLKGASRPINNQHDRAKILCSLECVDYVAVFDEDTPLELIKILAPDVLVKGGDYKPEEVIGRKEVEKNGGKLVLLPFIDGKSTTKTLASLEKLQNQAQENLIRTRITESIAVKQQLLNNQPLLVTISSLADKMRKCLLSSKGKLVICGNGGSASDALHFAGEIIGRFQRERTAWPAVVLNADVADYGYDQVFARQAEAHIKKDDIFIGISTSGNSENVLKAAEVAKTRGTITVALLGRNGGKIAKIVDFPVIVPCSVTARIQEAHICLIHILCELVETPLTLLADI